MLVLDPRPHGGFQSSPFFVKGLLSLAVMSFFKKEKKCCLSEFHSTEQKCQGGERAGKCAQAVGSPGSPYSPMEILPSKKTS